MKTKVLIFVLLMLPLIFPYTKVKAQKVVEKSSPEVTIEAKKLDNRAKILSSYLARFNSPLQYHAQDFIDAAEKYNLDWKLLPSIAGVESTFGKHIPGGFNGWGWGVYGTQAIYFKSWREAIFTIAEGLRKNYFNKGLTEPYAINRVYAASPHWGGRVTYFMLDIEKFATSQNKQAYLDKSPNIAAVSGQLAMQ
jgi:hypothetical protein